MTGFDKPSPTQTFLFLSWLICKGNWALTLARRTGQGELVEKIYRDVMGSRIPGGSEDVMLDLSVRQLVKNYQRAVKQEKKL